MDSTLMPNHIWAFDLGKGSEGEAVRHGTDFPHVESLLIPAELARRGPAATSGTPANKYRALKTREAHRARERWLETVWTAAGFTPLHGRQVAKVCSLPVKLDENGEPKFDKGHWAQVAKGDYRLEMEFAPKLGTKTKDGAPSDLAGADICYTSCLLRIKLLTWKESGPKVADWQIYKALRSALQTRGYGRVPWAAKESQREQQTKEEEAKETETATRWAEFKQSVAPEFRFPCYYDAAKMGLWNPAAPNEPTPQNSHLANSTRNVRFDRADVECEIKQLAENADRILEGRLSLAKEKLVQEFMEGRRKRVREINERRALKNLTLPPDKRKQPRKDPAFQRISASVADFFCYGPSGVSCASYDRSLQADLALRAGSAYDWQGALGQKVPRFDNRILNDCVLIPRFHVCKVDVRVAEKDDDKQGVKAGQVFADSLLATEVTFLLKLKNVLVADLEKGQRKLKAHEVRAIFEYAHRQLQSLKLLSQDGGLVKNWPGKVADCFALTKSEWGNKKKGIGLLGLRPLAGHEEVKAPKTGGRSAYSRAALRILKELILSGEAPSVFHARLLKREPELLGRLGSSLAKPLALHADSTAQDAEQSKREDTEHRKCGLLVSELKFLLQMRKEDGQPDSWENLFAPSQTLDALKGRHTTDGKLDSEAAIRELLGTINDPIVRHRLGVFAGRLKKLQFGDAKENIQAFGVPDAIVLEFVREDFMGEKALAELQDFQRRREADRKEAKEMAAAAGATSSLSALKYQLWKAQGGECLYGKEVFNESGVSKAQCLYRGTALPFTKLDDYVIDHIVPRAKGGPDAMVNYVLTTHETNEAKGDRTPFEWLRSAPDWDAYNKRVAARAHTLRNKKVQLLTREDAPELVQRYTALAETAWVSKLAQAIVNLTFGWTNANDEEGRKRVIVVSGGLTARVRRKYSLDKLLYTNTTDPEVLTKQVKNRSDKRHHALDAMVLTYIPQWARDPGKEGFFRFPAEFRDATGREDYSAIQRLFKDKLAKTTPRFLAYERSGLADTAYGRRTDGEKCVVVQRTPLRGLAYKQVKMKSVFSLEYAATQVAAIRDGRIQAEMKRVIAAQPNEAQWRAICDALENGTHSGFEGVRVVKVTVNRNEDPAEFKDLSKDGTGALRMRKKEHQGQFVFLDSKGRPRVEVVRVFDSLRDVKARLAKEHAGLKEVGFFQSMCQVELDQPVKHGNCTLLPGTYLLNTIKQDGRAQLTSAGGDKSPEIGLVKLLPAGFRRKA